MSPTFCCAVECDAAHGREDAGEQRHLEGEAERDRGQVHFSEKQQGGQKGRREIWPNLRKAKNPKNISSFGIEQMYQK